MTKWYKITETKNIPSMGSRIVEIGEIEVAIFKTKDGSIFAINNMCPHKKGKLSEGLVHEHIVFSFTLGHNFPYPKIYFLGVG